MSHPNEDFIKKFLATKFENIDFQRRLPGKKEIMEQYAAGKHIIKTDKLDKFLQEKSEFILSKASVYKPYDNSEEIEAKIKKQKQLKEEKRNSYLREEKLKRQQRLDEYYSAVARNPMGSSIVSSVSNMLTLLGEEVSKPASNWIEKKTPQGIFFYNKDEDVWMNNFGIIKKNFADFFTVNEIFDYSVTNSDSDSVFNVSLPLVLVGWGANEYNQLTLPVEIVNVQQIASGFLCNIVLYNDNTFRLWGAGAENNLPPAIIPINPILFAAGYNYVLAIQGDGTPFGWSQSYDANLYGQASPPEIYNTIDIDAGFETSIALDSDGEIYCWGNSDYGQTSIPSGITPCSDVAIGFFHACAIKNDGTAICWGDNTYGQCDVPAGITCEKIVAGYQHTCVLKTDGTVQCWGDNTNGECNVPPGLSDVIDIETFVYHTVALKSDGTAIAWGDNTSGQCNIPSSYSNIVNVSAGVYNTGLVFDDGTVFSVTSVPTIQVPTPISYPIDVKSNLRSGYILQNNGSVKSWGGDNTPFAQNNINKIRVGKEATMYAITNTNDLLTFEALGENGNSFAGPPLPYTVYATLPFPKTLDVDGGYQHTIILNEQRGITCFGFNFSGQCDTPEGLTDVMQVTASAYSSFALKLDGTIVSWGRTADGERDIPSGLSGITKISGGWYHVVALKNDGTIVCWGNNDYGQCDIPVGLTGVIDISAGQYNTGVLRYDGTIQCWGASGDGQLNIPPNTRNVVAFDGRGKTYFVLKEQE